MFGRLPSCLKLTGHQYDRPKHVAKLLKDLKALMQKLDIPVLDDEDGDDEEWLNNGDVNWDAIKFEKGAK